jgi:hypothetical protein
LNTHHVILVKVDAHKYKTFQTTTTLTKHGDWPIYHLDMKTTFLKRDLSKEGPTSNNLKGLRKKLRKTRCRLLKALYGSCQASWAWYIKIDDYLYRKLGLEKLTWYGNLYYFREVDQVFMVILYVDDVYFTR